MTDGTPLLTLAGTLDRKLAWRRGGSVRHLLVEALVGQPATAVRRERRPLNVALVVDVSGSMSGAKLEAAKRAVVGVVKGLGTEDRLTLVSFGSDVEVHLDAVVMDQDGRAAATLAARSMATRGMTNLSGGWLAGAERVAVAMQDGAATMNRVVLLSDGQANEGITDPAELSIHANELRVRGIATSTVGIGDGYNAVLMQALAEQGGGQMHDAEVADEIVEVLLAELREMQEMALEDLTVSIAVPASVQAEVLGGLPVDSGPMGITVLLGAALPNARKPIVLKLRLPEGEEGQQLLFGLTARARRSGTDEIVEAGLVEVAVTLVRGADNDAQDRDVRASVVIARLWHAAVTRTVSRLNRTGERREARHYLEREFRYFERYCRGIPELERLVVDMAQMLRYVDREWDERTRKEAELSSYKMLSASRDSRSRSRGNWSDRLGS